MKTKPTVVMSGVGRGRWQGAREGVAVWGGGHAREDCPVATQACYLPSSKMRHIRFVDSSEKNALNNGFIDAELPVAQKQGIRTRRRSRVNFQFI